MTGWEEFLMGFQSVMDSKLLASVATAGNKINEWIFNHRPQFKGYQCSLMNTKQISTN